jgi:hypothetical protein
MVNNSTQYFNFYRLNEEDSSKLSDSEQSENGKVALATVLDPETLNPKGTVWIRNKDDIEGKYKIIGVTSDGYYFYMLRLQYPTKESNEEDGNKKGMPILFCSLELISVEFEDFLI